MLLDVVARHQGEIRQLAIVAHELRNPLAAASCALRVLERSAPLVPEIKQALPLLGRQLDHISRIVEDLVDVASVASGKLTLRRERVDLAELLLTAIQSCRDRVEAGSLQLNVTANQALRVHADPVRLTQVFANLLDNAIKYSEPCGRIDVVLEKTGDVAVVVVADNGVGIRPDALPRIFDFFVQGGTPLTGSTRGLGVGLAVAKQVVEAHGGFIEASSAGIGFGSRFSVHLPLACA